MATSRRGGFLTSTTNLVGTAAAALGAVAAGVVGAGMLDLGGGLAAGVVAAVAAGCYGVGVALTPRVTEPELPAGRAREWTEPELRTRLAVVRSRERGLPAPVASVLADIGGDIAQILDRWDVVSRATTTAHEVASAVVDYLPGALDAYERIPVDLRERSRAGKATPTQSLREQFEVLHDHLESVRDAAFEADIQALESHGLFITGKYGRSALDL